MITRRVTSLLVVVVLAAAVAIVVLVATPSGARWLAREAQRSSGGTLQLEGVEGTLVSGMRAARLRVVTDAVQVRGEGLALEIAVAQALRGRLVIAALRAARIELVVAPAEAGSAEPFRMPTVATPVPVEIRELSVGSLRVGEAASAPVITSIRFAGDLAGSRLTVREIRGTSAGVSVRAAGTADLAGRLPIDAVLQWRLRDPVLAGAGSVRGDLASLDIAHTLQVPERVRVGARLAAPLDAPRLTGTARWESIGAELPGVGSLSVGDGQVSFEGWLSQWQATLSAAVQAGSLPAATIAAHAQGTDESVRLDRVHLAGEFGTLDASGTFDFLAPRRLALELVATNVDASAFRAGLEGRLSAQAEVKAELPGATRVRVRRLDGRLMGRPVAGSGAFVIDDGVLRLSDVAVRAGRNRLRADGEIGERIRGTLTLDAPELGVLWPDLHGSAAARVQVSGTRKRPVLDVAASGEELALGEQRIGSLELQARTDRGGRVDARLQARGVAAAGRAIGDVLATVEGTLSDHRFFARLSDGPLTAQLQSSGAWNGSALLHRIAAAAFAAPDVGSWELSGAPELMMRADAVSLTAHCWAQSPASLCLSQLSWSPDAARVTGELRDLDLERFEPWLPPDLGITGRARADLSLELGPSGLTGSMASSLADATVYYTGGDEPLVTPLRIAGFTASLTPEEARFSADLQGDGDLRLALAGRMAAPLGEDAPLDVELRGQLPDIAPLTPLIAPDLDLAEVAGAVTVDAAVGGTLRAPQWTGVARLARGAVALPDVGVKFDGIDIALLGDGSADARVQGSAVAGGPLTLSGVFSPLEAGGPTGWVRVRGNSIDAVKLPDRFVKASPDFIVRYEAGRISAEGSITIPKADIVVRRLPESAVLPSPDVVVRDRVAGASPAPTQQVIGGEIALVFGRDVRLRAFGLDTLLEGTLKLSQGSDGEPQGYGVVRLKEGKFGAYGKELTIERGTLGFAGPLDDPAVDIRATREVAWEGRRVKAGLRLSGTASRPESRVFAEPAMSEADALSYLISGRPLRSANQDDRSSISGAALALGVQQTSPITEAIGGAVTLDELGVEGGTLDETEIVAGKQLGSDLYVRFAYGVFSRIGTVLARYRLGRNVSIEAASGAEQSLDLIYSVERE